MELGGQIKRYRTRLGLSQEELADRIFVTRQSVSNWENGRTYPDLQSLLRLSDLFGLSLDELIKGDIETMKEEINRLEIQKMNRWGGILALLVGLAVALKVENIKKDNDVHTYKEILAFSEGRRLDELDKAVEKGKRPYQALVAALSSALLALLAAGGIALMYIAFRYLTRS